MAVNRKESTPLTPARLTFVGGGHFAQALACGIYARSVWKNNCQIAITARRPELVKELREKFPSAFVTLDNLDPAIWKPAREENDASHILIICTRAVDVPGVTAQLAPTLAAMDVGMRPTVMTMCPGILVEQLQSWLPEGTPIVRAMPNTPVACCQGATAIYPNREALSRVDMVVTVLKDISPTVSVLPEESLLDVVAAISGSAPAYFYYLIEALVAAGEANGVPSEIGQLLVTQSCLGAGMLARDADRPVATLRREVCVPGGSTDKAMACLEAHDFGQMVESAVGKALQANRAMGTARACHLDQAVDKSVADG